MKAQSNLRKHLVRFENAVLVFEDPKAIFEKDRIDETGELHWRVIGRAEGIAVLLVVRKTAAEK